MKKNFAVKNIEFGSTNLSIIAGACVIESQDHVLPLAEKIKEITEELDLPFIVISSFDKDNRLSHSSYRGPSLDKGLRILEEVKIIFDFSLTINIPDAGQFRPELKSRVSKAPPLFREFIKAAVKNLNGKA